MFLLTYLSPICAFVLWLGCRVRHAIWNWSGLSVLGMPQQVLLYGWLNLSPPLGRTTHELRRRSCWESSIVVDLESDRRKHLQVSAMLEWRTKISAVRAQIQNLTAYDVHQLCSEAIKQNYGELWARLWSYSICFGNVILAWNIISFWSVCQRLWCGYVCESVIKWEREMRILGE